MDPKNFFVSNTKYQLDDIVECEQIKLGFSNEIYRLKTKNNKNFQVRFGLNNDIIFRDNEKAILKIINDHTYLYYDLKTGNSIRKWIEGRNPITSDLDINFLKKLVEKVEIIHQADISVNAAKKIRTHDNYIFEKFIDQRLDPKYYQKYLELVKLYENLPKCLSHNDLSLLNLIYNETTKDITIIDYEWGRINNYYWDYANFVRDCDLDLELATWLANFAKLEWKILRDHIFIVTCFACQWSMSMEPTSGINAYLAKSLKLLEKYYQKFYKSKKKNNSVIFKPKFKTFV
ncbi:Protein kinase family protein [[Mycoplasma] cavipharyngis]|uniref:phosphotransferase n=1 Tax=[Mycoplasma] cavipharyngis TaxID=92757 RepID=UPI003703AD01